MKSQNEPVLRRLEVNPPKRFTYGIMMLHWVMGILVLGAPILLALLVVSSFRSNLLWVVGAPLLALAATAYILPFGFGNAHLARLTHALKPNDVSEAFLVQATFAPRLRSGFRALLEDADDVGYVILSESNLEFRGDSVTLLLPFEDLIRVERRNIGLRGLFLYGPVLELNVRGLDRIQSIRLAERQSLVLPNSRVITNRLWRKLDEKVRRVQPA
jgi:hypothetical protein